ncbi:MAG: cell envelope integrity protein TolA [Steroidobacteraceae bacterium]|nr:cell envelope integrity protein TolA [Steroidobacteraceae bacterium]
MAIERKSDRWISLIQSVLLHAAVIGALAYGFYAYKQMPKPPAPTLAVEGTVVEADDLQPVQASAEPMTPPPEPEPPPPEPEPAPVEDMGPPTPTPEEIQQRQQEEQRKLEEQRRAEEERLAAERKAAEERAEAERKAAEEKAAAERKAREEAERKRREEERLAQERRAAEEKKRAEEKRRAEEERLRAEREAELRRSLEAEERARALRSSDAFRNWIGQITARIQRAWLRPPSAKPGIDCVVYVTQVPGGTVTNVRVGACNGDAAVRESIESAVLRASPLPPPPDPAMFERNLEIHFAPTD